MNKKEFYALWWSGSASRWAQATSAAPQSTAKKEISS